MDSIFSILSTKVKSDICIIPKLDDYGSFYIEFLSITLYQEKELFFIEKNQLKTHRYNR